MVKYLIIVLLFLSGTAFSVLGQNGMTGRVKDVRTGEPLIGVNVALKGNTSSGTITDIDGNFTLTVSGSSTLIFSYIGYSTKEVAVGNQTHIVVEIEKYFHALDEVVVVGYGVQKKVSLPGPVSSVKNGRNCS